MKKIILGLMLALFLVAPSQQANAAVIDFNSMSSGNYANGSLSPNANVSFLNTGGPGFSVQSQSLGAPFSGNAVLNSPYTTQGNSTIASFLNPVNYVSVTMGDYNADADDLYLNAYDSSNNLLGSDFYANPASSSSGYNLSVTANNIAKVEFYGIGVSNNSVYWDNFTYCEAPVPEPSTAVLGLLGLGGLINKLRKKQK